MCDIGTMILAESKRSHISAADFGTYLARGAARPAIRTDYADTQSVHKREKGKGYPDYSRQRRDHEVHPYS
jgi:hypothetical protein